MERKKASDFHPEVPWLSACFFSRHLRNRAATALFLCFALSSATVNDAEAAADGSAIPATAGGGNTPESGADALSGKYRGRVMQRGGNRSSEFELDLSRGSGTITMYRAERACRHEPVSVTSIKDDVVLLKSKGVIAGCGDRVFELKRSGDELSGTMTVYDRLFDVKATRE